MHSDHRKLYKEFWEYHNEYLIDKRKDKLMGSGADTVKGTTGANDIQVGGDHYKQKEGVPQHWDLGVLYGWDFFQYNITKYVMRWKNKNGLEDLKKAAHHLQKYIEEVESGRIVDPSIKTPKQKYDENMSKAFLSSTI